MMLSWAPKNWPEPIRTTFLICLSFAFFRTLQFVVRWYLFGKCTFKTFSFFRRRRYHGRPVPDNRSLEVVPPNKKWRISNEVVSLIHAAISGLWALYACVTLPELVSDMDTFQHEMPRNLIFLSFGYLIHDLVDLLVNERSLRIIELLFHHVVVITAFIVTLVSNRFLGILMVGLLMELNSIFLHTRSLLNLYGQKKNSTAFRFVALLNVASFVVFRIVVSFYLFYWWFISALGVVIWYLATITLLVTASLTITNLVLFYRVLAADGLLGKGRSRAPIVPPIINIHHPAPSSSANQSTTNLEAALENGDLGDDDEEEDEVSDDSSTSSSSSSSSSSDEKGQAGDKARRGTAAEANADLEAGRKKGQKRSNPKEQKSNSKSTSPLTPTTTTQGASSAATNHVTLSHV